MNELGEPPVVAIIGMGGMGSWIARRLVARGVVVRTVLAGRSGASAARAAAAGVLDMPDDDALVAGADAVLSVVPPQAAVAVAERLLPILARAYDEPVYVDCNAVDRTTVQRVADLLRPANCPFVDATVLGHAPPDDGAGPRICLAGPDAAQVDWLAAYGLRIEVLDAPIGAAAPVA